MRALLEAIGRFARVWTFDAGDRSRGSRGRAIRGPRQMTLERAVPDSSQSAWSWGPTGCPPGPNQTRLGRPT